MIYFLIFLVCYYLAAILFLYFDKKENKEKENKGMVWDLSQAKTYKFIEKEGMYCTSCASWVNYEDGYCRVCKVPLHCVTIKNKE